MTTELVEGLVWWTSKHPEWPGADAGWGPDVSSYAVVTDESVTLFDPLAPPPELSRPEDRELVVMLTYGSHARSTSLLAGDGATAFAPDHLEDISGVHTYRVGDVLPGDVHVYAGFFPGEAALWLPTLRGLVIGECLYGSNGDLRLPPQEWLPDDTTIDDVKAALAPLSNLNPDWILTAHGPPVVSDAAKKLRLALT